MENKNDAILFEELDRATEDEFEQMFSDMQADEADDGRFRIDNDNLADWAVRKIQEERAENKRLHDIAEEQVVDQRNSASVAEELFPGIHIPFLAGMIVGFGICHLISHEADLIKGFSGLQNNLFSKVPEAQRFGQTLDRNGVV